MNEERMPRSGRDPARATSTRFRVRQKGHRTVVVPFVFSVILS